MSVDVFNRLPEDKKMLIIYCGLREFSRKGYADGNTDVITKECSISKGILFHYFQSKKNYYLYILEYCIKLLTQQENIVQATDFYQIIFDSMDKKMELFKKYPLEIRFVNMASKEVNEQLSKEKNSLLVGYIIKAKQDSAVVIQTAIDMLHLKNKTSKEKIAKALSMYVNTIVMYYLELYKDKPEEFYQNADVIKAEVKEYINFMLYGIIREENL